jgi:hypothetical protein
LKNKIEKLTLTISFGIILLCIFPAYIALYVYAQQQVEQQLIGVKITSPSTGQQVPVGELTISGTSTDDTTTDCTVYADWNDQKPFQKTIAAGPGGVNDYSNWIFTFTEDYHLITNGTNNLTSKLSCFDANNSSNANLTKSYSVDVIGVATATSTNNAAGVTSTEEVQQQQESPTIDSNITTTKENNTAAAAATPPELAPSVPTLSPVPLPPSIEEQEEEEDTTIYWDIE